MNEFVCELCYPDMVEIAKISDYLYLVKDKDQYSLLGRQGHKGNEIVIFPDKPIPDPDPECLSDEDDGWLEKVDRLDDALKIYVTDGYYVVNSFMDHGWNKGKGASRFSAWLFNYCGNLIEEYEKNAIMEAQGVEMNEQSLSHS